MVMRTDGSGAPGAPGPGPRRSRRGATAFGGRRYALATVMAAAGVPSTSRLARLLDVTPERVRQWKRRGLSFDQADALCCRLGVHVSSIEPDYFAQQVA